MSWRSALWPAWHSFPNYKQPVFTPGPSDQWGIQTSPALLQGWACDLHLINHHFLSSWPRWSPLGWEYNPRQANETQSWNSCWRCWERGCLFELRVAHGVAELSLEPPRKEPAGKREQAGEEKLAWGLRAYEHCCSLWTHMFSYTWTTPSLPLDFLCSYTSLEISFWSLSQFKWSFCHFFFSCRKYPDYFEKKASSPIVPR